MKGEGKSGKRRESWLGGPSQSLRRNGGGQQRQQQFFFNKSRGGFDSSRQRTQNGGFQQHQQRMSGKRKLIQGNQPQQHHAISTSNTIVRTESNTSMDKTIILRKENFKCSSGRKVKTLQHGLGNSDKGSKNIILCKRISNSVSKTTKTKQITSNSLYEQGAEASSGCGSGRDVEEGSHYEMFPGFRKRIYQQPIFSGKERRWLSPGNKSKTSELLYPLSTLQNGRFASSKIHVAKRRLHVQIGSERCIFFSTFASLFEETSSISLVGKTVRVSVPLFWLRPSPENIYKIIKSSYGNRRFRGYDAIFNFFLRWCKLNFVLTHFTGFFACCW